MALEVDDDERQGPEEEHHPDALERALAVALARDLPFARLDHEAVHRDRDREHEDDQERAEGVAHVGRARLGLRLVPEAAAAREGDDAEEQEQTEGDKRQARAPAGRRGLHGLEP